jgi:zinc protease
MADLNAASMDDVMNFFRRYYAPNNASIAIVGDFDPADAKRWVERYFGPIPSGPPIQRPRPAPASVRGEQKIVLEDRVQLPRLYIAWHTPALYAPGDADMDVIANILTGGQSSRLIQRLVFQEQLAQSVTAGQISLELAGQFWITVQPRPGVELPRVLSIVDEELRRLHTDPPADREIQRALNNIEVGMIESMETAIGRADQLNTYQTYTGDPGYAPRDFERYRNVTQATIRQALDRFIGADRVILSVVPQGQTQLQAHAAEATMEVGL